MSDPRQNAALLEEVIARAGSLLRAQARRHAQLPDDAEEALNSAYALFIERFDSRYRPIPWLQTTVKREAWRIAKRAWRRKEQSICGAPSSDGDGTRDISDKFTDPESDPLDAAEAAELHRCRVEALEELKPDERSALLLLGLGCSYAEIGALRGWTYTKVNRCISEGRASLRGSAALADRSRTQD